MRLIDADPLMAIGTHEDAYGYVSVEDIANAPTIEPKCADGCLYGWGSDECERCLFTTVKSKRGRWIIGNKTSVFDIEGVETWAVRLTCSECSYSLNFVEGHTSQYRFCPNCGAEMVSEDDQDIVVADEAYAEYKKNPKTYTLGEIIEMNDPCEDCQEFNCDYCTNRRARMREE